MKKELTEVYCGSAKGKTTLALGHSLRAAAEGKSLEEVAAIAAVCR